MEIRRTVTLLLLLAAVPGVVSGQGRRSSNGGGMMPPYDVSQEMTVSGTLIKSFTFGEEMSNPLALIAMDVEGRTLHAFLGPAEFVAAQEFTFEEGVAVEIKAIGGFRFDGEAAVMARSVRIGDEVLQLRDEDGKARWE